MDCADCAGKLQSALRREQGVVAADVNGDGRTDLVAGDGGKATDANMVEPNDCFLDGKGA